MAEQAGPSVQARTYVSLIAAPSILGLYAFAGSTFIVSAYLAGWYGGPDTPLYLLPFAAVFGGVALLADRRRSGKAWGWASFSLAANRS
jgi:succinate-acetate transporter protein